ncbi:haem peroxidase, animal [Kipferlia bialata]|uniref:Haem peroxidase, animal n=1 Tax=Kipferlia bialata TaxID=797122 RepID=A0A9K3D1R7_9EUKA|nr:haem peroxidase, animal [Kipferlia bialata]|eukprot:g7986.t1
MRFCLAALLLTVTVCVSVCHAAEPGVMYVDGVDCVASPLHPKCSDSDQGYQTVEDYGWLGDRHYEDHYDTPAYNCIPPQYHEGYDICSKYTRRPISPFAAWVSVVYEAVTNPMTEEFAGAAFEYVTPPQTPWYNTSARVVSNAVCAAPEGGGPDEPNQSTMLFAWGQFVDHDLDLLLNDPAMPWPIPVPEDDPVFEYPIGFTRAATNEDGAYDNAISARIDLSSVYGMPGLRSYEGGMLRSSAGGRLLPRNEDLEYELDAPPNLTEEELRQFFVAGDIRVNEQALLTSIHTLFMVEHNRLTCAIADTWHMLFGESLSDETLYNAARTVNVGQAQAITYQEYLPRLLNLDPLALDPVYTGEPRIFLDFAAVAFRLGHSQLPTDLPVYNKYRTEFLPLADVFFDPEVVTSYGWASFVGAVREGHSKIVDNFVVDGVRNFLFENASGVGSDLAALNMQRGRDVGVGRFMAMCEAWGIETPEDGWQMWDSEMAEMLQSVYDTPEEVDAWVGGICEPHPLTSGCCPQMLGTLNHKIVQEQFRLLRDTDPAFYNRHFSQSAQLWFRHRTLGRLYSDASGVWVGNDLFEPRRGMWDPHCDRWRDY